MESKMFWEVANYWLQATTFDANHLTKFIDSNQHSKEDTWARLHIRNNSDYFNRSNPFKQQESQNQTSYSSIASQNVRPSCNFLNLNRDMQRQTIYIDQYDGTSQVILNSTPKQDKNWSLYDTSKDRFYSSMSDFNKKIGDGESFTPKAICPEFNSGLKTSKR